jgi:hypothetical protein
MKWFLLVLIFIACALYLIKQKRASIDLPAQIQAAAAQAKPALPAELQERDPAKTGSMAMSQETRKTLYDLAGDSSPENVRWAAIELLYRTGDASISAILKDRLEHETETSIKLNIINKLLAQNKDRENLRLLALAQNDMEPQVRLAALVVLASYDREEVMPYMNRALKDDDNDVKLKAIESIKNLQASLAQQKKDAEQRARDQAIAAAQARQAESKSIL